MKIKKGDNVIVLTGKDKGKKGKVTRAFPKEGLVLVEGINKKKVHKRSRKTEGKGEIVEKDYPIDVSNVRRVEDSKK